MRNVGRWIAASVFALVLSTGASATEFKFATFEEGREILLGDDEWYAALGPAEIAIRLASETADKSVSDLKALYGMEVLDWSEDDKAAWKKVIKSQRIIVDTWADLLPPTVYLVQISNRIEGGLPHTRKNAIFFPEKRVLLASTCCSTSSSIFFRAISTVTTMRFTPSSDLRRASSRQTPG